MHACAEYISAHSMQLTPLTSIEPLQPLLYVPSLDLRKALHTSRCFIHR